MLMQRVITAFVLLAGLLLLTFYTSAFLFAIIVGFITLLAGYEWTRLIGDTTAGARWGYLASLLLMLIGLFFLLGIAPDSNGPETIRIVSILALGCVFWVLGGSLMRGYPSNAHYWNDQSHIALMGIFVLLPTWAGLVELKYLDQSGLLFFGLVALVSIADIAAYFTGRAWGRKKLAPKISPAKSWAGFWGGMAGSVGFVATILLFAILGQVVELSLWQAFLTLLGTTLVFLSSVAGDLFESMLKRNRSLKDSGNLLPGHGGILDRLDSLTAATPVAVLLLLIIYGSGA